MIPNDGFPAPQDLLAKATLNQKSDLSDPEVCIDCLKNWSSLFWGDIAMSTCVGGAAWVVCFPNSPDAPISGTYPKR